MRINEMRKLSQNLEQKLTSFQRTRHTADENRFSRIQRHGRVQHIVGIRQTPRPDLNGLVLDGGRRNAQIQLIVVGDAGLDQLLHATFVLLLKIWKRHNYKKHIHML